MLYESKLYTGAGGVGKTTEAIDYFNSINLPNKVIFTFTKDLKEKFINRYNTSNTFTIHSFAYNQLNSTDYLPEVFKKNKTDIYGNTGLKSKDFIELYDSMINYFDLYPQYIPKIDAVYLEEAQDFEYKYLSLIRNIKKKNQDLIVIGTSDPFQNLYRNNNKFIETLKSEFFLKEVEKRVSHRHTLSLQNFINGFAYNSFNTTFYDIEQSKAPKGNKPKLIITNNYQSSLSELKKIISENTGKEITILCRTKAEIKRLNKSLSEKESSSCKKTTIHAAKGSEFDIVILFSWAWNSNLDYNNEKNVINVAISRSKTNFYFISSIRKNKILKLFKPDTYDLTDIQSKIPSSYIKRISNNYNYIEYKDISRHMLDSVSIEVPNSIAPFREIEKKSYNRNYYHKISNFTFSSRYSSECFCQTTFSCC